jgi:hypothetical protein
MNTTQEDLRLAKNEAVRALLRPDCPGNVVAVGIGKKSTDDCLRIYVVSKLAHHKLTPEELVPLRFLGVPTDVIEIGRLGRKGRGPAIIPNRRPEPGAPIRVDTKAPNVNSGATGTLGMVAKVGRNRYILGCNHILAVNGRVESQDPTAKIVSAEFVGDEQTLASPLVYVRLDRHAENVADCALAQIEGSEKEQATKVQAVFPDGIGNLASGDPMKPEPGKRVTKIGAATYKTEGKIVDVDADLYVDYSFGRFRFKNQIVIEGDDVDFATAGDSGSIIVDQEKGQPVGMVFAASGKYAIACQLLEVVSSLQKELQKKLEAKQQGDPKLKPQLEPQPGNPNKVKLSLLIK